MSTVDRTDWTPEELNMLRKLWANPEMSARQIGVRMGRSRRSVTGKAHYLGLPRRLPGTGCAFANPLEVDRFEEGDDSAFVERLRDFGGFPVIVKVGDSVAYAYPVKLGLVA